MTEFYIKHNTTLYASTIPDSPVFHICYKKNFVYTVIYPLSIGVSTNLASQIMACDCCEVGLEDKPCLCSLILIVLLLNDAVTI